MKIAVIELEKFSVEAVLLEGETPQTVSNFCELVSYGFYDGLSFFKQIPNLLVQTGCPLNNGNYDAGYHIKCELNPSLKHDIGTLGMANAGRDTASSQFYICTNHQLVDKLDGNHTIFGKIVQQNWDEIKLIKRHDIIKRITIQER